MRRAAATLALALAALIPVPAAHAAFGPCPTPQAAPTTCETLTVPLDRSGTVSGQVHLFVERRAPSQASRGALLVLAGGPGQAATPLIDQLQEVLAPALTDHDLVVFDQRGAGESDAIDCPALDAPGGQSDAAVEGCATLLGPRRAFYTSRDTADDIDAIRQSLGLDKISIYGVSYGTFTALTYARRYPDHVESLVLDSVVSPDGRDPLDRNTFAAFPRVLRDICADGCAGITADPVADLGRLVARLRRHGLKTSVFTRTGRRVTGTISEADVANVLEGADFDPTARAELPSSLVSAVRGDGAPLARLLIREELTSGEKLTLAATPAASSQALFFATSCEEIPFPWSRTSPLSQRPGQLLAALAREPASTYAPFDRLTEAQTGTSRPCLDWPDASPTSPLVTGPAPNVPALMLEGVDDTRTPIADAQEAATLFPQAQLLAVPHTGHSVLGTELGSCSENELGAFFAGHLVSQCGTGSSGFHPTPVAPRSFRRLHPLRGVSGKRGRTAAAVAAALSDTARQAIGYALTGSRIAAGGLRGGRFSGSFSNAKISLKLAKLVYLPGVRVSGTEDIDLGSPTPITARIKVSGAAASKGSLTFQGGGFSGRLGGRRVHSHGAAAAAALRAGYPSASEVARLRALAMLRKLALPAP